MTSEQAQKVVSLIHSLIIKEQITAEIESIVATKNELIRALTEGE